LFAIFLHWLSFFPFLFLSKTIKGGSNESPLIV
jgi:hypothetical protein